MFTQRVEVVIRATLVAATGAFVSAIGVAGPAIAAPIGSQQTLVGAWSGPVAGDTGECGKSSAEYAFSPDGTYRYAALYENCDAVMIDGHYELQAEGNVLQTSVEVCGDPRGCPAGPSILTTSISTPDPDSIVLDGLYPYHRQKG